MNLLGIKIANNIPEDTKIIFCGGSFTKIAKFVKNHNLDLLVANGGFAGNNIVNPEDILDKFKNHKTNRTYNFNLDVKATESVLNSPNIKKIFLVSKNICHSIINTVCKLHKDKFLENYNITLTKRLHDLLMVKVGIDIIYNVSYPKCEFLPIDYILEKGQNDSMCKWGSVYNENSHIFITTKYTDVVKNNFTHLNLLARNQEFTY